MSKASSWLTLASALALCSNISVPICAHAQAELGRSSQKAPAGSYQPASIKAAPRLECKLHAKDASPDSGLPVFTDNDGYARFYAVRMKSAGQAQVLTCKDEGGQTNTYSVDLTSGDTFVHRPLDLAKEPGIDRPALTGDPLSYSQAELSRRGYGVRPKPSDRMYPIWLEAATKSARMLYAKKPGKGVHGPARTVTRGTAPPWVGSVMTGSAPYSLATTTFKIPTLTPGAAAWASIWPGVGGYGTQTGLIQAGVFLLTTPQAAQYSTFREYCCGMTESNGYAGNVVPSPGDRMYVTAWYCDEDGKENIAGGYGCTHVHDLTADWVFSCTVPKGKEGSEICWSVKAEFLCSEPRCALGGSAEFIIENTSQQLDPPMVAFPRFTPFSMVGLVLATTGSISWVDIDPTVWILTDYTPGPPRVTVTLPGNGNTAFRSGPKRGRPR
jgi:hypothetical protein